MKRGWQAGIAAGAVVWAAGAAAADERAGGFDYRPPQTEAKCFDGQLGMLERERGEYATHLATHAANLVVEAKADAAALEQARRLIALALQLSPRNRKALVVNYQLRSGILPEATVGEYSAGVLARLLTSRADLLLREGGAQNELLARAFIDLAARMDPRNEDAVFAAELQRLDHGEFNWAALTDAGAQPAAAAAAPGPEPPAGAQPDGQPKKQPKGPPPAAAPKVVPEDPPRGAKPQPPSAPLTLKSEMKTTDCTGCTDVE